MIVENAHFIFGSCKCLQNKVEVIPFGMTEKKTVKENQFKSSLDFRDG